MATRAKRFLEGASNVTGAIRRRFRSILTYALGLTMTLGYCILWLYMVLHIHVSAESISHRINIQQPGSATHVTFTGDDIKQSVTDYGDTTVWYISIGSILFACAVIASAFLLVSLCLHLCYGPEKNSTVFWVSSGLTIASTVVLCGLSITLLAVRILVTVQASNTHLMATQWCAKTTASWDVTAHTTTHGASCADVEGITSPGDHVIDKECCSDDLLATGLIDTFCCMFDAPYDWGHESSAHDQVDLRDGQRITRLDYIAQTQFANKDIWKQSPEGGLLHWFDITVFIALFFTCVAYVIMSMILIRRGRGTLPSGMDLGKQIIEMTDIDKDDIHIDTEVPEQETGLRSRFGGNREMRF